MIAYSDEQILKGILRHDNLILQYIYKQYYYNINYFIRKNQGSEDDASDIFQEAIIIIYRKIKENDLVFEKSSFKGYLFSVCRFLWLKQLEKDGLRRRSLMNHCHTTKICMMTISMNLWKKTKGMDYTKNTLVL